jgi:membrane protease YdiL (CAAX protease family)
VLSTRVLMFAVALGVVALLMITVRQRPRDLFLVPGKLRARSSVRLPGTRQPLSWAVLGTLATAVLVVGFATQMWLDSAFPGQGWSHLLASAPLVVAAAALNPFSEEVLFRAGPLATLHRIVGPIQAVLMTSAWFGLAHYYGGIPSGPVGAVQSCLLGLLLGVSMMATRGLGWPVIIHFGIDVVVFASIAVAIP